MRRFQLDFPWLFFPLSKNNREHRKFFFFSRKQTNQMTSLIDKRVERDFWTMSTTRKSSVRKKKANIFVKPTDPKKTSLKRWLMDPCSLGKMFKIHFNANSTGPIAPQRSGTSPPHDVRSEQKCLFYLFDEKTTWPAAAQQVSTYTYVWGLTRSYWINRRSRVVYTPALPSNGSATGDFECNEHEVQRLYVHYTRLISSCRQSGLTSVAPVPPRILMENKLRSTPPPPAMMFCSKDGILLELFFFFSILVFQLK